MRVCTARPPRSHTYLWDPATESWTLLAATPGGLAALVDEITDPAAPWRSEKA